MTEPKFDATARSIAERKTKGILGDYEQKFGYKIADLHSQFVKAGGITGSAHQQIVRDACKTELRERFQAVWEILRSVSIDFNLPLSATVAEELKSLMREIVINSTSDLRQAIHLTRTPSGFGAHNDVGPLIEQVLPEVEADIDQFVSTAQRRAASGDKQAATDLQRVFLSHAAADAPMAILLKDEIMRRMPGATVFCSSNRGDIRLGFRWSPEIQRNLQEAGTLMLLATTRSVQRNWVWFESGVFWFDRPIIICCCGELLPDGLPPPLGERQSTKIRTAEDLKFLFGQLSAITGVALIDVSGLESSASRLADLERNGQLQSDAEAGWVGVAWEGKFLVCDGSLEELSLIDPEYYQESMKSALEASGFRLVLIRRDQIGEFKDHGVRRVYVTDKKKWRKEVQKDDLILVVEPPRK